MENVSNVENVCPQALREVTRELRRLAAAPPPGTKLLLRDDDLTDVVAVIDGPAETPYAGGSFRVRLVLGREFPTAPPRAYFLTKLFHPNVAADSGQVCVDTLARDWRPEAGLGRALQAIRCLLIAPNPDSALNAEAAALLRDHYDAYAARARLLTEIHARPGGSELEGASLDPPSSEGAAEPGGTRSDDAPRAKRRAPPPGPGRDKRRVLKRL